MKLKKLLVAFTFIILNTLLLAQAPKLNNAYSLGGFLADETVKVIYDSQGNIYAVGYMQGLGVTPFTLRDTVAPPNTQSLTNYGSKDGFLVKINAGGTIDYTLTFGGESNTTNESALAVAVDDTGNVYVGGYFSGDSLTFTGGSIYQSSGTADNDAFLLKVNLLGNVVWAHAFGGTSDQEISSLAFDPAGFLIAGGTFTDSLGLDPTGVLKGFNSPFDPNFFIAKYSLTGSLQWAEASSGAFSASLNDLKVDSLSAIYFAASVGGTFSFNFNSINEGAVVGKLTSSGGLIWHYAFGDFNESANAIDLDKIGNLYVAGNYSGSVNVNPTNTFTDNGAGDGYLMRLDTAGNFIWAIKAASNGSDAITGVYVASPKQIFMLGHYQTTSQIEFLDTSNYILNDYGYIGDKDIFFAEVTDSFIVSNVRILGNSGTNADQANYLAGHGNKFAFGGFFNGTPFSIDAGNTLPQLIGQGQEAFIGEYEFTLKGTPQIPTVPSNTQKLITFLVDMQNEQVSGNVYLEYIDTNNTIQDTALVFLTAGIYGITLPIDSGLYFQYKFRNDQMAETLTGICAVPDSLAGVSREWHVTANDTLNLVCFNSCTTCPTIPTKNVTFLVDMQNESPILNVWLDYIDQNTTLQSVPLNLISNNIFGITLPLDSGIVVQYKFRNGQTAENLSGFCAVNDSLSGISREWEVLQNDTLPVVCFNSCINCTPPITSFNVTFLVNMANENVSSGVYLSLLDTQNQLVDTPMANIINNLYGVTLTLDSGSTWFYKFKNGQITEQSIGACFYPDSVGGNSRFISVNSGITADTVCFSACTDCTPKLPGNLKLVSFQVDMSQQIVDSTGVYLSYLNSNNVLKDTLMNLIQGSVYSITLALDSGTQFYYRFKNGSTNYEQVPYQCNEVDGLGNFSRLHNVSASTTLVAPCFSSCGTCVTPKPCSVGPAGPISGVSSFCLNDEEIAFTINPVVGANTYYWFFIGAQSQQIAAGQGTTIVKINITNSSATTLAVVGINGNCVGDTAFLNLAAPSTPVSFNLDITNSPFCSKANGQVEVVNLSGATSYQYSWTSGDTTQLASNLTSGYYECTVIGNTGCKSTQAIELFGVGGPNITYNVAKPSCIGSTDGIIDIHVTGGNQPYQYKWLSGQTTADISGLAAGSYFIEVIDDSNCVVSQCIEVQNPQPIEITATVTSPLTCNSILGQINPTATGGTGLLNYFWDNGSATPHRIALGAGAYTLVVMDSKGCYKDTIFTLNDNFGPNITIDSIKNATCNQNTGGAFISLSNSNSPTFNWSNGSTTEDLSSVSAGNYVVTVTENGCKKIEAVKIGHQKPETIEICMVTVNDSTGNNLVVFDKTAAQSTVTRFNIYRETCSPGNFIKVGSRTINQQSEFEDLHARPNQKSWKYKISTQDACGNESNLSGYHQTIYAVTTGDTANGAHIQWNNYIGFNYNWFYVERFTPQTGWQLLDSLPNSILSAVDASPIGNPADIAYSVYVKHPFGCTSYDANKNYNTARSNRSAMPPPVVPVDTTIDTNDIFVKNILPFTEVVMFPNPATNQVTLIFEMNNASTVNLTVYTIHGAKVLEQKRQFSNGKQTVAIDVSDLAKGMYWLQIEANGNSIRKPILKQ